MRMPEYIDLHMHTTDSDGSDTPAEVLAAVKETGLELFSVTDHDAIAGCVEVQKLLTEEDPLFFTGVEFSCKDEKGKYHILGYGYDPEAVPIREVVDLGHMYRMQKLNARLKMLREKFGFEFSKDDVISLYEMMNPGKPHIANLMVKYGYAADWTEAIEDYLNQEKSQNKYVRPEEAIEGILKSGGVPVLAHPSFGNGSQFLTGEAMEERIRYLMDYGLQGVEAFYSGFSIELIGEILSYAEKYDLYITAGSDYHGTNKTIRLGQTNLPRVYDAPVGMKKFIRKMLGRPEPV